ncbi:MAG: hypothetical protein RL719_833 [Actinomycetota bacterium]|jgi:methionine-rich copper-binding protein CopC
MRHSFAQKRLSVLAAAALAALSLTLMPQAALAHDEISSTSPQAETTVEAGKIPIVLTFSEAVMQNADNAGIEVSVTGPQQGEATERTDGCIDSVEGNVITESADIELPGTYVVNWRSVSEDGHPIDGTFNFTVENTTNYKADDIVMCNARTMGVPTTTSETPAEPQYLLGVSPLEGLIGGIILIAIISVFGALSIRRKETERAAKEILKKRRENEK